jgi:glycosyltransferase 2 family protein
MPDGSGLRPGASAAAAPAAPASRAVGSADPDDEPRTGAGPGLRSGTLRAGWSVTSRVLRSKPVRWGFVAVAVGLGCYWVVLHWAEVSSALGRLGFLAVAGALIAVLLGLLASMQVWRVLLAGLGSPLPVRPAARVLFIGQLGKYLPGSIWPVLAQMELGAEHQVPRLRSASASVLAMLVSVLTGLLTALVTLPFVAHSSSYRWVFLAAPVVVVCLHPKVLNHILNRVLRLARRPPLEQPLSGRAMAAALAWSLCTWICYGLQMWLLATQVGLSPGSGAVLATGGFAFAWCVGFLVVFAPAGAGIREVLLIATFSPVIGVGAATAVTLVSRVLLTAGDFIMAGGAAGLGRRPARRGEAVRATARGQHRC